MSEDTSVVITEGMLPAPSGQRLGGGEGSGTPEERLLHMLTLLSLVAFLELPSE